MIEHIMLYIREAEAASLIGDHLLELDSYILAAEAAEIAGNNQMASNLHAKAAAIAYLIGNYLLSSILYRAAINGVVDDNELEQLYILFAQILLNHHADNPMVQQAEHNYADVVDHPSFCYRCKSTG